ncbi:hypothetical protein [Streptomyces sp. NPDC004284]|uniref:hypothetical protein n=1 Tax=Streptomyces sp. NPDC004284 TaxID=3364695 RepID=UPI0036B8E241
MKRGDRSVAVDNRTGVVVIGDGNQVVQGAVPMVRSAYREQVRRIAPPELVHREAELSQLADFSRAGTGYLWWRADAWAGKTALLSWFALDPPPGIRIVSFFVTARWAAQNDAAAYVDVVLEQLAELAAEPAPALLTAATRQAHLLRLYGTAARACAARGERLVLLVDGLDEDRGVTTGPDAHSIAALLPYDLPVIVSGRPNPPVPADVPEDHPLRDPAVVRLLTPSPAARAIRVEAERELKHLLGAGGLAYDFLALLTAADGGLTAEDLAELTGEAPYRVKDVLRTGPGRTFTLRGDAYLLAHGELDARAREMLGARELERCRGRLHEWAGRWRERGWPELTPTYLLLEYFPMLRETGNLDRMVVCALDEARHDRLLATTGADEAALREVRAAEAQGLAGGDRTGLVSDAVRLAFHRTVLEDRAQSVPLPIVAGWAAIGEDGRAVRLARSMDGVGAVEALCVVARELMARGDPDGAAKLAEEAETATLALLHGSPREWALQATVHLLVRLGDHDRAASLVGTIRDSSRRSDPLLALVRALGEADRCETALRLVREEPDPTTRARAMSVVVETLIRVGRVPEAEQAARGADDPLVRALVLLRAAVPLRDIGREEAAEAARAEGLHPLSTHAAGGRDMRLLRELTEALVAVEEFDAAREVGRWGDPSSYELALAASGRREQARAVGRTTGMHPQVRGRLAERLALAGDVEGARALLDHMWTAWDTDAWVAIASALLARGALDQVAGITDRLVHSEKGVLVITELMRCLVAGGRLDRAHEAARAGDQVESVVSLARALYGAGNATGARRILDDEERRRREPSPFKLLLHLALITESLGHAGRTDSAGGLLRGLDADLVSLAGDGAGGYAVRALLAAGRFERAVVVAGGTPELDDGEFIGPIVAAHVAAGAVERADRLVEDFVYSGTVVRDAALAFAAAGEVARAMALVPRIHAYRGAAETYARMAWELAESGHREEAERLLGEAVSQGPAENTVDVIRVLLALDRRVEAVSLALRAVRDRTPDAAVALVLVGAYGQALRLFRALEAEGPRLLLSGFVGELVRAAQFDAAAALLKDLHHLGLACGRAYAELARAHPRPAEARRFAAFALHLGAWEDSLEVALAVAPDAIPVVEAEGERLRRALEV